MKVSVIIPTRNAEQYMDSLINRLLNQTIRPSEIIVIDTESNDKTKQICMKYDIVKFFQIKQNEFNHGKTRNEAAKLAIGDILVFMTQDALPEDSTLIQELINPLLKKSAVCSYARQLPNLDASVLEVFSRSFNYGDVDIVKSKKDISVLGVKTFFFSNVCSAYLREEFFKVNGFPENMIMNEDMIIAYKFIQNNKNIYYASSARVLHSHKYTYIQQFKRNFDIGVVFADTNSYFMNIKSESEGIKFVKEGLKYLIRNNKIWLIPYLIIESGFKFIGYRFGKNYKKLPSSLVKKMSMHSFYFNVKEFSTLENKL
ncbi:glycosyltransferase family 2 protein [Clostridioides sp. ES-S-0108-01]|uniref:glycosyltransferase family 2 protein n=1 Tax=Clostridioides sp. ES-S-0108-01 TaxID=2770773 RepID=UPI001D0C999D|nr:glycosyltransferase family 2 protein [Clostridioides sp. ES-S-0108-01]UDN50439.1 glycosyltransferase family 2 protein [Clostridioides sp. ES-S-0107-01]